MKTVETTSSGLFSLPIDLVEEILMWLPSRSLARLRCTCRSWNELISSGGFVDRYLQNAAARHSAPAKLVLTPLSKRHARSFHAPMCCRDCPRIIGARPCRGLVLFCRPCALTYSVCNPSTGGVLHLPPCHSEWYMSSAGIGFDSATGKYKVVQLVDPSSPKVVGTQCRVLTVGDDPLGWREPLGEACTILQEDHAKEGGCIADVDPVFANGRLHWTLTPKFLVCDTPQGILAFSIGDESFVTVPLPPFASADLDVCSSSVCVATNVYLEHVRPSKLLPKNKEIFAPAGTVLAELDGCLCMVRDLRHRRNMDLNETTMFEIWKLGTYETGEWSLDYRIDLPRGYRAAERLVTPWLVMPLAYVGGDPASTGGQRRKAVLLATTAHEAHVYDPEAAVLHRVASMSDDESRSCDAAFYLDNRLRLTLYQESPVQMDGMEHDGGDAKLIGYSILNSEQN
ncbi:Os05g0303900 [Oryza sativa Japonica Group]|uniref:Os05g0303900 protein n=3 Tax=Oryza TaxID=4527 RepID=B9FKD6_ORYSJ|nr:hypothetical protein OsJ_17972 [Oryza sativa Japonica Group]BAS93248.1 Os05g0303900 [Oryza sativa Japonica Group]